MKSIRYFLLFLPLIAVLSNAHGDDSERIIVTASRLETPVEQVASSVSIVTSREIEQRQLRTVGEALKSVPGLSAVSSGSPGQTVSVYVRGVSYGHTLVLIDGVKANDPSESGRAFDFANLSTENIERIEVIRGAESVIYGSDSIGGVIHIITKKGKGAPKGAIEAEYGTYGTYRTAAQLRGGSGSLGYSFGGEISGTKGFSSANESAGNAEADGRTLSSANMRLSAEPVEKFRADLTARYSYARFDIDVGGGRGNDDPNYANTDGRFLSGLKLKSTRSLWWQPELALEYSDTRRTARNDPDPGHPDHRLDGTYNGSRIRGSLQNSFYASAEHSVGLVLDAERESVTIHQDFAEPGFANRTDLEGRGSATVGAALEHQFNGEGFFSSTGGRVDRNTRFGTHGTFRVAPGYRMEKTGTTLKGSVGSGFKAPTIFQLFAGTSANPALKPETSLGIDAGIEQELAQSAAKVSATYFSNSLSNVIYPAGVNYTYVNIDRASSRGVELMASATFSPELSGTLSYTRTTTQQDRTGQALQKVPAHQLFAGATYAYSGAGQATAQARFVGTRLDVEPVAPYSTVLAPSYFVLNFSVAHSLETWAKGLKAQARIENALGRRYEEVRGFGTAGRAFYLGLRQEI